MLRMCVQINVKIFFNKVCTLFLSYSIISLLVSIYTYKEHISSISLIFFKKNFSLSTFGTNLKSIIYLFYFTTLCTPHSIPLISYSGLQGSQVITFKVFLLRLVLKFLGMHSKFIGFLCSSVQFTVCVIYFFIVGIRNSKSECVTLIFLGFRRSSFFTLSSLYFHRYKL